MTLKTRILISDDNGELLAKYLESSLALEKGVEIDVALTPKVAFVKATALSFDIILLDISFSAGGLEGLDLLRDIRTINRDSDIIMLSGITDKATILKAMELGATDYVVKASNERFEEMLLRIKSAMAQRRYRSDVVAEGKTLAASVGASVASKKMLTVFAAATVARKAADRHVLITGPTGAGKEVVAKAISRPDRKRPFVVVNCAAISESVMESELFGYVRGAFTGALSDKAGLFDAANGGDIFLDEIACLTPKAQAALLRVIQSGEYSRVGSPVTLKAKVRVIAATNENLEQAVVEGKFREDLLARVRVIDITIPPLCQRRDDISPIIDQVIESSNRPELRITDDCRAFLEAYSWPQNVRQLRTTLDRMIAFSTADFLSIRDIPAEILSSLSPESSPVGAAANSLGEPPTAKMDEYSINIPRAIPLDKAVDLFQRAFIEKKISDMNGQVSPGTLAATLGLPRTTLLRRMKGLGIDLERSLRQTSQINTWIQGGSK